MLYSHYPSILSFYVYTSDHGPGNDWQSIAPAINMDVVLSEVKEEFKDDVKDRSEYAEAQRTSWMHYTTTNSNTSSCEFGWSPVSLSSGEFCYFFNMTLATKHDAVSRCQEMNSSLPLPASLEDDRVLKALFPSGDPYRPSAGSAYGIWLDANLQGFSGKILLPKIEFVKTMN